MSMQGWMKLFGAACILCGAAGCGIWFAGRYRQRILELEQLKQMVFLLKGQILYASAPLPEALETVGKRMDGALGTLFLETAASLESQPGEPISRYMEEGGFRNGKGRQPFQSRTGRLWRRWENILVFRTGRLRRGLCFCTWSRWTRNWRY